MKDELENKSNKEEFQFNYYKTKGGEIMKSINL